MHIWSSRLILLQLLLSMGGSASSFWSFNASTRNSPSLPATTTVCVTKTGEIVPSTTQKCTHHWIVLVHGWLGNPTELGYLQQALLEEAKTAGAPRESASAVCWNVHAAQANDGNTSDGIVAGGKRLAAEINQIIQDNPVDTLSIVGNSLGGLYARYALAEISALQHEDSSVQPKVFCTTATPHLGVSKHTYLPLPSLAENIIAPILQQTGRDLFLQKDSTIIYDMSVESQYTKPLQRFSKRLLLANAFHTDFQVPTATAAFLSDSDSPHYIVNDPTAADFITVQVETRASSMVNADSMATRLDNMGWTKVFCDVRPHLWQLPFGSWIRNTPVDFKLQSGVGTDILTSRDLLQQLASLTALSLPLGHTILVANAKNNFYASINASGRPIMDYLAARLVKEISSSQTPEIKRIERE